MHRREVIVLIVGLVIGLFVGMIVIGSSDDLRELLFGTAIDKVDKSNEYYLVTLEDAETWLAEMFPDESEKFEPSVSALSELPAVWRSQDEFEAARQEFNVILPYTYGALIDQKDITTLKADGSSKLSACLGMDTDPYEPTVYLYLTIPKKTVDTIEIPTEWEKLAASKENTILWQLLACYPDIK
jgi:hypothetical protein